MLRFSLAFAIALVFGSLASAQIPLVKDARVSSSALLKGSVSKSGVLASSPKVVDSARLDRAAVRLSRATSELSVTHLGKGLAGPTHDPRHAYISGRVKNLGLAASPSGLAYEFVHKGIRIKRGTMPSIAPGQEITLSHNFPGLKIDPGLITFRIFTSDHQANNSRTISQ